MFMPSSFVEIPRRHFEFSFGPKAARGKRKLKREIHFRPPEGGTKTTLILAVPTLYCSS